MISPESAHTYLEPKLRLIKFFQRKCNWSNTSPVGTFLHCVFFFFKCGRASAWGLFSTVFCLQTWSDTSVKTFLQCFSSNVVEHLHGDFSPVFFFKRGRHLHGDGRKRDLGQSQPSVSFSSGIIGNPPFFFKLYLYFVCICISLYLYFVCICF